MAKYKSKAIYIETLTTVRFPGVSGSQISRTLAHESGKIVSLEH